jgi:hypothetical protein
MGRKLHALAQRTDSDDVLFLIEGSHGHVAVVHLDWTGCSSATADFPETRIFASYDEWKVCQMIPEHRASAGEHTP